MREKEFDKLVDKVTEQVTLNILGAHWVCYRCGDKSVIERVEKLEQKVAMGMPDVEIVRCEDCKHWTDENEGLCDIWDHYISNEKFFCGCGERRKP